eukprot:1436475-Rhodomonas_salina.1
MSSNQMPCNTSTPQMAAIKARLEAAKLRETLAAKHAVPIEGAAPKEETERATLANFYSNPASADMLAKAKMLFARHADADRSDVAKQDPAKNARAAELMAAWRA